MVNNNINNVRWAAHNEYYEHLERRRSSYDKTHRKRYLFSATNPALNYEPMIIASKVQAEWTFTSMIMDNLSVNAQNIQQNFGHMPLAMTKKVLWLFILYPKIQ